MAAMNTDNIHCGCFGLYPSYVAGILHSVKEIYFYVLCNTKLHYADYIAKCIAGKNCCISYKSHTEVNRRLSSASKTDAFLFGTWVIHGQLQSKLIFAQGLLQEISLSTLTFSIVSVNKSLTYITNEMLTSRHGCVYEKYTCDLAMPKRLASYKLYIKYCKGHT